MKLYVTLTSPFARMARIVMHEKSLEDRVEVIPAQTRTMDSPYYEINPSGRVPYLICDDGMRLEESQFICRYFDHLDGEPQFDPPSGAEGWEARRLEALARSLLDGVSVWVREIKRPQGESSPTIIEHERRRAERLTRVWEDEIASPMMQGPLNMAQITLICALEQDRRIPGFEWRASCPALSEWADAIGARDAVVRTQAPT